MITLIHRRAVLIVATAALLLMAACPNGGGGTAWTGNAKDFSFTTFNGKPGKLSDYAGQPVVVNFWAVWCPPCKAELPYFQEVYNKHEGEFVLLGVTADNRIDPPGFVKQHGYTWTFVYDVDGGRTYNARAIPMTIFIDREGNITDEHIGQITKQTLASSLAKIL